MNRSAFGKWQSGVSLGMLVFVAGCGPGSPLPPPAEKLAALLENAVALAA